MPPSTPLAVAVRTQPVRREGGEGHFPIPHHPMGADKDQRTAQTLSATKSLRLFRPLYASFEAIFAAVIVTFTMVSKVCFAFCRCWISWFAPSNSADMRVISLPESN
jgi:hypothetical protein